MKNKLACVVVRDLLPLYVDGLVSDETREVVNEHLEECSECSGVLRDIMPQQDETEVNLKNVDYLKKIRKKGKMWTTLVTVLGVMVTILGVSFMYYTGTQAQSSDIVYQTNVSGKTVKMEMKASSDTQRISRVEFNQCGRMVDVKVYTTPKLFFDNNEKDYSYTIDSDFDVEQVHMENTVLWENGMDISEKASSLYRAYNLYVGDMPANAKIADILGVSKQFGTYTNELKTNNTPYGWTLMLDDTIPLSKENLSVELMRADSCIFLAFIKNLDYVIWEYTTENGVETFKFTTEDATEFIGKDIKQFAGSVSDTQTLLNLLGVD